MTKLLQLRSDAALPRNERKARGAYYTPSGLARYVVGATLISPFPTSPRVRILDPACGDGALLVEVARRLCEGNATIPAIERIKQSLFGIDCDRQAVEMARGNVARIVLGEAASAAAIGGLANELTRNIVIGDALLAPLPAAWPQEFEVIVGNPPYVNIRQLAREGKSLVDQYRRRFRCAVRGFDLYVLFIERAIELLTAGGRCGFIVPNKLATLDYAAPCRRLLMEHTQLESITDFSATRSFDGAHVYPQVLVFNKGTPAPRHRLTVAQPSIDESTGSVSIVSLKSISQCDLNRRGVFAWDDALDVERRVPTRPFREICQLRSGTTGFVAQKVAAELREANNAGGPTFPFITSGNIDRYQVTLGNVRYLRRLYANPVLAEDSLELSHEKRQLFAGPKIIIAGLSRHLEAAYHPGRLALGVQVFAAAECESPFFVLGLLNSKLLSHLFRTRYSAKRLGGGYFAVNKGQLAQLPIVNPEGLDRAERRLTETIASHAERLTSEGWSAGLDREIDTLVYRLYRLTAAEVAIVEQACAAAIPRVLAA